MTRFKHFLLLLVLTMAGTCGAWAQSFITDLMVVGDDDEDDAIDMCNTYISQGWTKIDRDLNEKAGGHYIYLLYKTNHSTGSSGTAITGVYLRVWEMDTEGWQAPGELTHNGVTYTMTARDGDQDFRDCNGDLNKNNGSDYQIHLYYSKDLSLKSYISSIVIDDNSAGAVGENGGSTPCDLNKDGGGSYLYMHLLGIGGWSDRKSESFSNIGSDGVIFIESEAELARMAYLVNGGQKDGNGQSYAAKSYKLNKDLDITGYYWTPIGRGDHPFEGSFDGQGHAINGLMVATTDSHAGLFGNCQSCTIENVVLTNANISGTDYAGGVVGRMYIATLKDVRCQANVMGTSNAGGIVGIVLGGEEEDEDAIVSNCVLTGGTITGTGNRAAIFGTVGSYVIRSNNYYINPESYTGNDFDVFAAPVTVSPLPEGVALTFTEASTFEYDSKTYYGGTVRFKLTDDISHPINSVMLNDEEISTHAGSFSFTPSHETTSYVISVTIGEETGCTGKGTQEEPYIIDSAEDLTFFADRLQKGAADNDFSGQYLRLDANITVSTMMGTDSHPFRGIFDGNGHTITLAFGSQDSYLDQSCALFGKISNATIKDLLIAGSIYSSAQFNASLASEAEGDKNLIQGCVSSVSINSNLGGDGTNGGFIGVMKVHKSNIAFEGCAFVGELIGEKTTSWGGFIGWRYYVLRAFDIYYVRYQCCNASFTNCLFAPKTVNINTDSGNSRTFCRSTNNSTEGATYTDCYYTTTLQVAEAGYECLTSTTKPATIGDVTQSYKLLDVYASGIGCNGRYYYVSKPSGDGTELSPYIISSAEEWNYVKTEMERGNTYSGKYLKLATDDITVDETCNTFCGSLDGDGHTITLALGSQSSYLNQSCALFSKISNATIKNLRIAGSIYSSAQHCASIACEAAGENNLIQGCVSSVSINSNITGDGTNGGFIGVIDKYFSNVTFKGCAFLGELIGAKTTNWGGFVGWRETGKSCCASFTDCLFAPKTVNIDTSGGNSRTFCRADDSKVRVGVSYTNSYYTTVLQNIDGSKAICYDTKPETIGDAGTNYGLLQVYDYGVGCEGSYYLDYFRQYGKGTEQEPYLISNAEQWKDLGLSVSGGNSFSGEYLKLTGDIETDQALDGTFSGNFDGASHTITVNNFSSEDTDGLALFKYVNGATIHDLKVAGEMEVGEGGAALVGKCVGSLTLQNIAIDANISYDMWDLAYGGGVIGHADHATLNLSGVVFKGCLDASLDGDIIIGGIIGFGEYTATLTDVLFSGTFKGKRAQFVPIAAKEDPDTENVSVTATNVLADVTYTDRSTIASEKIVYEGTPADISTAEMVGEQTKEYGLLTAYANGIKYGDTYYAPTTYISIADTGDNSSVINENNGQRAKVRLYGRTLFKDGDWNTICLPFDVTIADSPLAGAIAKPLTAASINGTTLNLTFGETTGTLAAGTPYIIRWDEDDDEYYIVSPTFSGVIISNADNSYDNGASGNARVRFMGSYDVKTFTGTENILLMSDGNKLQYVGDGTGLGSCRAYFQIGNDNISGARLTTFDINFGNGENTTGILLIESRETDADCWYDLQGRRVANPSKSGLYIRNGKKVLVK
ncbi:MAG: hypothetical protein K5683_00290 [Prevotella sp.]|nr:hypothetical protein [Prevotella sp.]